MAIFHSRLLSRIQRSRRSPAAATDAETSTNGSRRASTSSSNSSNTPSDSDDSDPYHSSDSGSGSGSDSSEISDKSGDELIVFHRPRYEKEEPRHSRNYALRSKCYGVIDRVIYHLQSIESAIDLNLDESDDIAWERYARTVRSWEFKDIKVEDHRFFGKQRAELERLLKGEFKEWVRHGADPEVLDQIVEQLKDFEERAEIQSQAVAGAQDSEKAAIAKRLGLGLREPIERLRS